MVHLFWRQNMLDVKDTNNSTLRFWLLVNTETFIAEDSETLLAYLETQHWSLPLQSRPCELSQEQGTGFKICRLPLIPVSLWPQHFNNLIFLTHSNYNLVICSRPQRKPSNSLATFHTLKYCAEHVLLEISMENVIQTEGCQASLSTLKVVRSMLHCPFIVVISFLQDLSCYTGNGYDSNHCAV